MSLPAGGKLGGPVSPFLFGLLADGLHTFLQAVAKAVAKADGTGLTAYLQITDLGYADGLQRVIDGARIVCSCWPAGQPCKDAHNGADMLRVTAGAVCRVSVWNRSSEGVAPRHEVRCARVCSRPDSHQPSLPCVRGVGWRPLVRMLEASLGVRD